MVCKSTCINNYKQNSIAYSLLILFLKSIADNNIVS